MSKGTKEGDMTWHSGSGTLKVAGVAKAQAQETGTGVRQECVVSSGEGCVKILKEHELGACDAHKSF